MLRGTLVKVNGNEYKSGRKMKRLPEHLIGDTGIALERMNSGYIKVLTVDKEGYLIDLCYPEDTLDIIEPPVEL
ncbi:hypothetical protein ES703_71110 [subsurface metagenome]